MSQATRTAFADELEKIATMTAFPSHWEGDSGVGEIAEMMIGRKPGLKATQKVEQGPPITGEPFDGEKTAAHLRIGRRPIGAAKLLKKESELGKKSVIEKLSGSKAFLAGMAAGAGSLHYIKKVNEDRKMGKQIRVQQRGY